ncbi:MAG: hypothetical protein FD170_238 [Bacteroidetes bacterium]|nr:MAG: hypothetical protein FD170_238 [Bacteroidota bacterium]
MEALKCQFQPGLVRLFLPFHIPIGRQYYKSVLLNLFLAQMKKDQRILYWLMD